LKSLLLFLHSHRADLGPDTGEGKTQKNSEFEAQDLWNRELASRGEIPPPQGGCALRATHREFPP
jgi:hypothetical protein